MRYTQAVIFAVWILLAANILADDSKTARDAFQSGNYEIALTLWQPLAEAGDSDAQCGLGQMYGNGFGVMMDDALAIKWYGLAAANGHSLAQFNLAVMHQNGWGVPQSDAEAMKLYALAAEQGVSPAMVSLGRFYAMDFADSYDPVQAYKWFSLANLLGNIDAMPKLDAISGNMTAEQIAESKVLVADWSDGHSSLLAQH